MLRSLDFTKTVFSLLFLSPLLQLALLIDLHVEQLQYLPGGVRGRVGLLPRTGFRLPRRLYGRVLFLPIKCIEHVRRVELPECRAVGDDAAAVVHKRRAVDAARRIGPKYGVDALLAQMPTEGVFRP